MDDNQIFFRLLIEIIKFFVIGLLFE